MSAPARRWGLPGAFALLAIVPFLPFVTPWFGGQVKDILIFCILALGLNVVVGYAGLLQLGIAAFFGIGAYITGILTVDQFPFHWGFWPALIASVLGAGVAGMLLAAPTLRLRGDYLAIVTLGFGEVVKFSIRNLESVTNGAKALNPIADPVIPGLSVDWNGDYRGYYYVALALLVLVVVLLRNLEDSRLGRAWMAIREDELAASCMGLNTAGVKLSAFALGAALAGLAGSLYAASLDQTAPDAYDFARSISVLCFLIIGGMGNIPGALVGTFVLMGYDNVLTPVIDDLIQKSGSSIRFSSFKLVVFGLALVLMMRFRPSGILPSRRAHREAPAPAGGGA
jgi:branched-chain amino acid transport system permease protein